jgi:hypothetical protein
MMRWSSLSLKKRAGYPWRFEANCIRIAEQLLYCKRLITIEINAEFKTPFIKQGGKDTKGGLW